MNSTSNLTFQWTSWTLGLGLLAILATCIASYWSCHRVHFRRSMVVLESMRVLLVSLAVILLNQPEWIEEFRPQEKPTLVVLGDVSGSMNTRDVVERTSDGTRVQSRQQAIESWLQPNAWQSLQDRFDVVIQPIDNEGTNGGTDLHQAIQGARDKYSNLQGLVLLSDGDWNSGLPPVQSAMRLRLDNIPIQAVPVGSSSRLPDVELLSLDAPTFGVAGKAVRIPFTIESSLPRAITTSVTLKVSDGETIQQEVKLSAMGRTSDAILWKPSKTGEYSVSLVVPNIADETIQDNNEKTSPIVIREEKLRVLVIESYPRWEYRYLRNALSRDPGVDVQCLLFHPGLSKVGGGNKDYISAFPDGLDQLAQYDVVFLGDVGIDDGQLSVEQCRLLKGLVEQQASGLVFMPGWQGRQQSLLGTELRDLYPVILDEGQTTGWGSRTPSHFELTELGRRSLLTKLADTQDENISVWENLPGFQWYAPILRAKPGSEVLAVHRDASNSYGRIPLLATRTYGNGKVLFMGTDGAWRWRKGVEDLYHYRFWGQVVRWMAYQRNMAKGESMRLFYSPEQPVLRQTLSLNANVMEKNGEPLNQGEVTVRVTSPSGKAETIRLESGGGEWGAFSGKLTPKEPGQYQVSMRCVQTGATLETSLFVQGADLERVGMPARPEVMAELARVSRGQVLELDKMDKVVEAFSRLPEPQPEIRRVQLWSHPLLTATLIGLLGLFWIGRKAIGLI